MMIRTPTSNADAYAWHRAALLDDSTPRYDGDPQAGWYKRRMVKGGPWVPVEILISQEIDPETGELLSDERLIAMQMGKRQNAQAIWTYCRPIPRDEYDALIEQHQTNDLMAATHAAIDLSKVATLPGGR